MFPKLVIALLLATPVPTEQCPGPALVEGVNPTTWRLPKSALVRLHASRYCLNQIGRAEPVQKAPTPRGVRLSELTPGGFAEALGFKNGDVVRLVAGLPIHTKALALAAYFAVLVATEVTVEIERGGKPRRHRYLFR